MNFKGLKKKHCLKVKMKFKNIEMNSKLLHNEKAKINNKIQITKFYLIKYHY